MPALKAQVKNGRLVLDEPTDLPEGDATFKPHTRSSGNSNLIELDDRERLFFTYEDGKRASIARRDHITSVREWLDTFATRQVPELDAHMLLGCNVVAPQS